MLGPGGAGGGEGDGGGGGGGGRKRKCEPGEHECYGKKFKNANLVGLRVGLSQSSRQRVGSIISNLSKLKLRLGNSRYAQSDLDALIGAVNSLTLQPSGGGAVVEPSGGVAIASSAPYFGADKHLEIQSTLGDELGDVEEETTMVMLQIVEDLNELLMDNKSRFSDPEFVESLRLILHNITRFAVDDDTGEATNAVPDGDFMTYFINAITELINGMARQQRMTGFSGGKHRKSRKGRRMSRTSGVHFRKRRGSNRLRKRRRTRHGTR